MRKNVYALAVAIAAMSACASKQATEPLSMEEATMAKPKVIGTTAMHAPQAVVYRTAVDYNDRVPVTMDDARTEITSYPAPSDLRTANGYATPIPLKDGYLLDRRGVGKNTVFLDYTYAEYAALQSAPPRSVLMTHIIDKNPITEMYSLPIKADEAIKDTSLCDTFMSNGFKGCKQLVKRLRVAPRPR